MKNLFAALLLLAFVAPAHATRAPYNKETNKRFKALEDDSAEASGIARKMARFEYDVSLDGGASSPSTKSLGVTLPANAVVTSLLLYVNTTFSDGAQVESLAIQCNADKRDLMDWVDIGSLDANSIIFGGISPTAASALALIPSPALLTGVEKSGAVSIPTACEIKALVRGDSGYTPYTAGKLTGVVEYFLKD